MARRRLAQHLLRRRKSEKQRGARGSLKPLVPDGMTMPEMALRFILNNQDVSTIIPGMRKRKHVEANLWPATKVRSPQRCTPNSANTVGIARPPSGASEKT